MNRVHWLAKRGALCFLAVAWGSSACGNTTRSCTSAECPEASEEADGVEGTPSGAQGGSDAGGSGGVGATGADGPSGDIGSTVSTGSGASGASDGSGTGGFAGMTGSGGSAGLSPDPETPGAFDCGESEVPTPLVRLTNTQYDNTVLDLLGVETIDVDGTLRPSDLLANDPSDSITDLGWEAYRLVAAQIAGEVMGGPLEANFITCDPPSPGCLSDTIATFGRKAFRRPLTADEQADYERLMPEDPMEISTATAEAILTAMLTSPSFLFRLEQGGLSEPRLTSHEVASRLAYFLWNGPPDDELSAAADADELRTVEQVAEQTARMLDDPRLLRSFSEFHRGYLGMFPASHWGLMDHDTQTFPSFSTEVKQTGLAELEAFLEDVVVSGGSFQDLFLSNVGFVNQHTAPLYGLEPDNFGSELVRVQFDAAQRPGMLTRLAFLSSFSSYASTSPVLRGAFVTNQILNVLPGPPPPSLPDPVPVGEFTTNRARVTAMTAQPACAACHPVHIDPIGFVLENYDAVGEWQTVDPLGGPIDTVADVFLGDEIVTVQNSLELMHALADSTFAQRNYADEVIAYAFSRPPNAHDACLADALAAGIAEGISLADLWAELVRSDAFLVRGGPAD